MSNVSVIRVFVLVYYYYVIYSDISIRDDVHVNSTFCGVVYGTIYKEVQISRSKRTNRRLN